MTESQFIEKNKEKWRELEDLLSRDQRDADRLHELFVEVSSDLSYARTFYANRSVRLYLNNLTQRVCDSMSTRASRVKASGLFDFFKSTLPLAVLKERMSFLVSLFVFLISVGIGVVSTRSNPDFARVILGDDYINLTEDNINQGDPMAIYKDEAKVDMFLGITTNNIRVAFLAFVLGLLGTLGTVVVLVSNGIMLGAFQYYFFSKGLFLTSFLTIWIHGTIEISAIIIAGAAGIVLGKGLLFPGTYDRVLSLQLSARRALIILLGTVPLFVLAGILESFVTRHTGLPMMVKVTIIVFSLLLILAMWIMLPFRLRGRINEAGNFLNDASVHYQPLTINKLEYRTIGDSFILAVAQIRQLMGPYLKIVMFPALVMFALINWFKLNHLDLSYEQMYDDRPSLFQFQEGGFINLIFLVCTFSVAFSLLARYLKEEKAELDLGFIKKFFLPMCLVSAMIVIPPYFLTPWVAVLFLMILSPQFIFVISYLLIEQGELKRETMSETYQFCIQRYFQFAPAIGIPVFFAWMLTVLFESGISTFIVSFISWHEIFDYQILDQLFIQHLMILTVILLVLPLTYFILLVTYYSQRCWTDALDLKEKLKLFGEHANVLES